MLTLKKICLLKVTRLNLTYDDIPLDLQTELKKMKKFSGHFVGNDQKNYEKKSSMTVQYMGDKQWQFHVSHTWNTCSKENCSAYMATRRFGNDCRKRKQGVVEFLLEEDKEVLSGAVAWKALAGFGPSFSVDEIMRPYYNEDLASTVLTVEEEDESDEGGSFSFTSKLPGRMLKCDYVYCNHFSLDHTGNIRSLSMTCPVTGIPKITKLLESEGTAVAGASSGPDEESVPGCGFWDCSD